MTQPNTSPSFRLAVGSVRASTEEQLNSPEVQLAQIASYCQYRGFTLAKTFPSHISATRTKFLERPANIELLKFCEATGVRDIVIAKVDRAFRSVLDLEQTATHLTSRGYVLHFLDLQVDTSTAMGKAMLQMAAVFAEMESRRRAERQEETLVHLKGRKRKIGTVPYGQQPQHPDPKHPDHKQLVPVPEEQAVLRQIRTWHEQYGKGAEAIATLLTERGIPTKKGNRVWRKSTVAGLLPRLDDLILQDIPQHETESTPLWELARSQTYPSP